MFRIMVGKSVFMLMNAKYRFIKLKRWLTSMFTLDLMSRFFSN